MTWLSALREDGLTVPQPVKDRGEPGTWGLIHGDLHRDNILVDATAIGFIDFDDCGYGSFTMDLAALLESFERRIARDALDRERLRSAILEGYAGNRALPADIEQRLADHVTVRLLVMLQFLPSSQNDSVQSWAREKVVAIVRRLADLQDQR